MIHKGNYFIESLGEIGSGGFGYVEKVRVLNLSKTNSVLYARKVFSPIPENNTTEVRLIADLRERFSVEVRTQCFLNVLNPSCIVHIAIHDTFAANPYFVMELGECSLAEDIEDGKMTDLEKQKAVKSIVNGLKTIHSNNYIHRDLKPDNIIRFANGNYKISDFGLVKDQDTLRAEIKTKFAPNHIGTDGYRAPEVTDSGFFCKESDIYAVGKIIKELYPNYQSNKKMKEIIARCTSYFPDDRYSDVDVLFSEYLKACGG